MTVVSAIITKHGTAHASDSYITERTPDGARKVLERQQTKLVYVKHFRGALAYWGLAVCPNWSTLEWLRARAQAASQFSNAEKFANVLAADLNVELGKLPNVNTGIGIHFTAYELINGYWIPELFLITNWDGIPYTTIRPSGVGASRETYHALTRVPPAPDHRDVRFRLDVHHALQSGTMFGYNNGDPELFNPVANAIFQNFKTLGERGVLVQPASAKAHFALVRRPIEVVSRLLSDFSGQGTRVIGGKPHDLCILSNGQCSSSTGDG